MEEELELRDILAIIFKRWKLLVIVPLAAVLISALYTHYFIPPTYESSTTLMVLHSPGGFEEDEAYTRSDLQLSRELVKTYSEIVKSRRVAQRALHMADEEMQLSYSELLDKVDVGLVSDTELIHITISDNDPERAAYWANLVTDAFKEEVVNIMRVENVNVLDEAIPSNSPVSPNPALNMAVAFVLGVMIALGVAFLLEYLDNTIKTPKDVMDCLELPVLGTIPDFSGMGNSKGSGD